MLLGYAGVSADEQDTRLQRNALMQAGCECIYEEKASGTKETARSTMPAKGMWSWSGSSIGWRGR